MDDQEVELHNPDRADAVRRTLEMMAGNCTLEMRDGRYYITAKDREAPADIRFVAWGAVRQGYVKRTIP